MSVKSELVLLVVWDVLSVCFTHHGSLVLISKNKESLFM